MFGICLKQSDCSHLEANIDVFDTVANVGSAEPTSATLVECGEARPQVVSNDCDLVCGVWLDAPATHGSVHGHLIQKVWLEHSIICK